MSGTRRRATIVGLALAAIVATPLAAGCGEEQKPGRADPAKIPDLPAGAQVEPKQGWDAVEEDGGGRAVAGLKPLITANGGVGAGGETLFAGEMRVPERPPGTLPERVRKEFRRAPKRSTVKVSGTTMRRYRGATKDDDTLDVLVIGGERKDLVVLCRAAGTTPGARDACTAVLATLDPGDDAVPPGGDRKLARSIRGALAPIARIRSELPSRQVRTRARRAAAQSRARARAAGKLRELEPRSRDAKAVDALASALRAEARELKAIGRAALKRNRRSDRTARRRLARVHARTVQAQDRLKRLGYPTRS